jgi:hypothetical protein
MMSAGLATIERMKSLLSSWEGTGDQRSVFLGCYLLMTQNMLAAIRDDEFIDSVWVEQLLHHFANFYFIALDAYDLGGQDVPKVWKQTFDAVGREDIRVLQSLLLGVNAHINFDLTFALVDMLEGEWENLSPAHRQDRFADHCLVNKVIYRTIDVVQDQIIEPRDPGMRILDELLGPVDEWAVSSLIRAWRDQVWRDAVALLESDGPAQILDHQNRIEKQAVELGRMILRVV